MEPAFQAHVQQVQGYLLLNLGESDTRVDLIDPLLRILGYKAVSDLRRGVSIPVTVMPCGSPLPGHSARLVFASDRVTGN